jgi:hypothetical protein
MMRQLSSQKIFTPNPDGLESPAWDSHSERRAWELQAPGTGAATAMTVKSTVVATPVSGVSGRKLQGSTVFWPQKASIRKGMRLACHEAIEPSLPAHPQAEVWTDEHFRCLDDSAINDSALCRVEKFSRINRPEIFFAMAE